MSEEILLLKRDGAVAHLTMNRPGARNSLSLAMLDAMQAMIVRLGADNGVHVIVIAGAGPGFCAGHDLKEIRAARGQTDGGAAFFARTMASCSRLMTGIVDCPKPVIAQVHGIATAAGCQLVASCDLALAADSARFATPGVNIGLFCSTPMVALTRNVGRKAAMEMLLTGDMIPAAQARDLGLVNRVVPADTLADETRALAIKIAAKAPATLRTGKKAFYAQAEMPLEDAYRYTSEVMVQNMLAPDADEGIDAFIEKRQPEWQPLSS